MRRFCYQLVLALPVMVLLAMTSSDWAAAQKPKGAAEPMKDKLDIPEKVGKLTLSLDPGGHTAPISQVLFTPDGKQIITISDDNTIRVWDTASGECLRTLRAPAREEGLGAATLCRKGTVLAVAGAGYVLGNEREVRIYLIDLADGRIDKILKGHTQPVRYLVATPDGQGLASSGDENGIFLWDANTGKQSRILKKKSAKPNNGLAFSPDGKQLAQTADGFGLRIWSVDDGTLVPLAKSPSASGKQLAWSPDGKTIALGDSKGLYLCNPDGSTRMFVAATRPLSFTPDSRWLLALNLDKKNPRNGLLFLNATDGKIGVNFKAGIPGKRFPTALSADGLLVAASTSHETFLWNTDGAQTQHLVGAGRIPFGVGWSSDGKTVAWGNQRKLSGELADLGPLEHSFRLDDLQFGSSTKIGKNWGNFHRAQMKLGESTLKGRYGVEPANVSRGKQIVTLDPYTWNNGATLLPGDRAVVCAGSMNFYDTRSPGKLLHSFQGHRGGVLAIAPSPDYRYLLTAGRDMSLRIWKQGDERPLLSFFFAGRDWIVWTEEGYYAASPGGERLMGWTVDNGNDKPASFFPAERFRKHLYRPEVIKLVLEKGSVAEALKAADAARGTETRDVKIDNLLPPTVVLTVDKSKLPTLKLKVQAEATAKSQPITALRLLLDGRPVPGKETLAEFRSGQPKVEVEWTFELPDGEHQLAVLARCPDSTGISAPVRLKHVDQKKQPALHVLTVGINQYKDPALDLKFAAADAEALAAAFAKNCQGQPFREVKTHTLLDQQATVANIQKELLDLRQSIQQQDLVVIFFACHGVKQQKSYYLLTHEADTADLTKTALSGEQLRQTLAEFKCQVLLMLDACHAAGFGEGKKLAQLGLKPATDDVTRDLTEDECGVAVMCAAMGHEKAEARDGHGLFTRAVLEALAKKPGVPFSRHDQRLYVHHLHSYVFDEVRVHSEERQHPFLSLPWVVESFVVR